LNLTDKVIKNTFYHFLSQILNFLFPLILTPFIISKLGQIEFGIYAIVMGIVGTFGLLDLSISTSFIKFISEYYNKKEKDKLQRFINSGIVFYLFFSLILFIIAYINSNNILSIFNIPPYLYESAKNSLIIGLFIFLVATSFTIFVSVLISLQKMYVTSFVNLILGILSFISTIIILNFGYRITGILMIQLISAVISTIVNIVIVKYSLTDL
jgi:O-antigen/teichoic acid export membrane protein